MCVHVKRKEKENIKLNKSKKQTLAYMDREKVWKHFEKSIFDTGEIQYDNNLKTIMVLILVPASTKVIEKIVDICVC